MTLFGKRPGLGVQIDSMSGERILALLPRLSGISFPSNTREGILVKELSDNPSEFFRKTKELLRRAVEILEKGEIEPTPGDHCSRCDYGDLCRSSAEFGETGANF